MKHPRPWAKFHITKRDPSISDYHAFVSEVMTQYRRNAGRKATGAATRQKEDYDG